ncbi:MAG: 3-deoxy-D-manno-octulosonic acid transferase [Candidatus Brocadiaceae bacterium]|nr:3-deoxy-D-manno-octulosonic acid transferase [Candidatus Brocadiaceae bacterium]
MPILFDVLYVTALAFASPYFLPKLITKKKFRSGLTERFGWLGMERGRKPCIWIHCASVGEVLVVKPLVTIIEQEFNDFEIVISVNTKTGRFVAEKNFCGKTVFYFPLDFSWIVEKVLKRINPRYVLLVELEIWPNFLIAAAKMRIPVVLINGRISEKSLKCYQVLRKISGEFFKSLSAERNIFCARTKTDAARLINLGIGESQIFVTGNMKYDNIITAIPEYAKKQLRCMFKIDKEEKVIVCGSTYEGEDTILLKIFKQLCGRFKKIRLILVPRHVERTNDIIRQIESMGLCWARKTLLDKGDKINWHIGGEKPVILIDTVGELLSIYSIADCVFVGRSLVPQGGQNMIEPAGLSKPVVVGPHTFNFTEDVQLLKEANAIKIAWDEPSLLNEMSYLLEHDIEARAMGVRAQSVVVRQRGAANRNIKILKENLLKERAVAL